MNQPKKPGEGQSQASMVEPAQSDPALAGDDSRVAAKPTQGAHDSGPSNQHQQEVAVNDTVGAPMPQKLQSHIGRHLQAMYDEVAQEPVPERLLNLLQELERKEKDG